MTEGERQQRAVAAAARANNGVRTLIEHARKGRKASEMDIHAPVENLLIAAKMTIELQHGGCLGGELGDIYRAVSKYLDHWRQFQ
jgi:hypothetical protein